MSYVPIVVEIKPDELLYSWISRLAEANSLSLNIFARSYIGQKGIFLGELPYDIKREYVTLMDNIYGNPDLAKIYLDHSTLRFDLMFETGRMWPKFISNICLRPDALNVTKEKYISDIHICPQCIEKDKDEYGFAYLHTSHHIRGVKACHIHSCMLMEYSGSKGHECDYNLDDYKPISDVKLNNADIEYARYCHALLSSGLNKPVDTLKDIFVKEIVSKGYSVHKDGFERLKTDFESSKYSTLLQKEVRYCFDQYLIKKKTFLPQDFIPILMFIFNDPQELLDRLGDFEPIMVNATCKKCGKRYLSHKNTEYSLGLCRDCYYQIPIEDRFDNLVRIVGKGEYKTAERFKANMIRMDFRHNCGRISSFIPNNFLYHYSRCECEKRTEEIWMRGYAKLLDYYIEFGTSNVPKRAKYKDYPLGAWCQTCRQRRDKLSDKQLVLLDTVGFDFSPFESAWDKNIHLYEEYVKTSNSGHIERSVTYKGCALGEWYSNQKRNYNNGTLKPERLERIRAIYPEFPLTPPKERKEIVYSYHVQYFEDTLKLLLEYQEENGTLIVPKRRKYKGYNLGAWCQQMRSKRRLGKLPEEQIKALDDIGFIWDVLSHKWNEDMSRYRDYVNETGIYEVSRETEYRGFKLGYWYNNLKAGRRNGSFTEQQKADILAINPHFFD